MDTRKLSAAQADLLSEAANPATPHDRILAVLQQLHDRPHALVLARLHGIATWASPPILDAVSRLAASAVRVATPEGWLLADRLARTGAWRAPGLRRERVPSLVAAARRTPHPAALLAALTLSPSGYLREASVLALPTEGSTELGPLLLRLDDIVPSVREAAERLARPLVAALTDRQRVRLLPLVESLAARERSAEVALVRTLLEDAAASEDALWYGLSSNSPRVRRASALRLAAVTSDAPRLLRAALGSGDPVLAGRTLSALRVALPSAEFGALCLAASLDPELPTREDLLVRAAKHDPLTAAPALRGALLHRRAGVRFAASWYLRKVGGHPGPGFYREAVLRGDGPSLRAAVAALGDDGSEEDLPLVLALLDDSRPGLCRAALRAAHRLGADPELLAPSVVSGNRRVSRVAVELLLRGPLPAMTAQIAIAAEAGGHVLEGVVRLVSRRAGNADLPILLRGAASDHPPVRRAGEAGVNKWLLARRQWRGGRARYRVSEADLSALQEALAEVGWPGGLAPELTQVPGLQPAAGG